MTRYPRNNETRIAVFPERLPKSAFGESFLSQAESQSETDETETLSDSLISSPEKQSVRTFNIMSKVDTVPRGRRFSLSRNGRRTILRAGSCFDSSPVTERLLLTGTLPGTGHRAHRALAEFSSYASKTLTNWLTRRSPSCKWQYVWEFQQRGALHIHLVVELEAVPSLYVQAHFKDEWNRILRAISRKSKVNLYAKTKTYSHSPSKTQADVTICDREPSRYISKYISKTSTHARSFGRYPPRTWYQCSRTLLASLRASTITYEIEGLSYGQARAFAESAISALAGSAKSGYRSFQGMHYAWSGYCYDEHFDIKDYSEKMNIKNTNLIAVETLHVNAVNTMRGYPAARCYARMINANANVNAHANGTLTQTEMVTDILTVMEALTTAWGGMGSKTSAAMFLKCANEWMLKRDISQNWTLSYRNEIDKICKDYLTGFHVRTKV